MRRAMMVSLVAGGGGGSAGFYRTITIDHTLIGATDQTDFPVLISGTYAYLATVANGGKVQDADGDDIGFFSDSALTTRLKHEKVVYDPATGLIEYWVKVPTVSHTSDTVIYLAYGDTSVTTDQSDPTNVWDANTALVHHMGTASSLSLLDSTSNARDGDTTTGGNFAGTPVAATGKIGGGVRLTTADYYSASDNASSGAGLTALSFAFWVKVNSNGATKGMAQWSSNSNSGTPFILIQNENGTLKIYVDSGYRETSQTLSTGTWYRIYVTASALSGSAVWKFYLNGSLLSTYNGSNTFQSLSARVWLNSGFSSPADATYDEWHIAHSTRGADWITADYNNQNSPSTFYAVGSEVAA